MVGRPQALNNLRGHGRSDNGRAGDPLQCADGVTRCERTHRGRDPNSIAPHLSLPPCDGPVAIFLAITNQRAGDHRHRQT